MWFLQRNVGKILDSLRDGAVYEIYNTRERRVLGYLFWSAPEWLASLGPTSLQYSFRSWNGRTVYRDIYPTATEAVPVPRRRHGRVLADA